MDKGNALSLAIVVILFPISIYMMFAFFTYDCAAFKHGLLSYGHAPARCIK